MAAAAHARHLWHAQLAHAVLQPRQLKNGCPSPLFEVPCRRQQNFPLRSPPPPPCCNFSFSYFRLHTGCQFRLLLLQFQHLLVPLQVISHTVIVAANRVKALHLHWASNWKCKGCDRASEATRQVYLPASTAQHNTCISIVIPIPICFFVDLSMVCCGVVWCGVPTLQASNCNAVK